MPPKKADVSKKAVEKQKQRVIEDKTFGLKNKKGAKQQKFIQQVQKQVTHGNKSAKELDRLGQEKLARKEDKLREKAELNELFKPVAELQKCAKGVNPKSVLCAFFKQGQCLKGDKCKFSHDLTVERKAEKRGIYADEDHVEESMDDWDIAKLEEVVSKKHDAANKGLPPSTIVCKYFLEAVENMKYGWFWECPNGKACHYRHALPPGFVLKREQKKMEEQKETISLDDLIERERAEKIELGRTAKLKREADFKLGRTAGISGREVFEFNPNLVKEGVDEEVGEGDVVFSGVREQDENEYNGPMREIDLNTFLLIEEPDEVGDPQAAAAGCAGVGIVLSHRAEVSLLDWIPVDSRLCEVHLATSVKESHKREANRCIFVVSAYSPVVCKSDAVVRSFYDTLNALLRRGGEVEILGACAAPGPSNGICNQIATIFEISRNMYIRNAPPIRLLKIRRQSTTGFAPLGAHQAPGRVRVYGELSKNFRTPRGVRQGCPLSLLLVNFVIDEIMRRTLEGLRNAGVQITCEENLVYLKYADDIVPQVFLDELTKVIPSFGMHFAPTKCKVMLVDVQSLNAPLKIQGEVLEVVERFTYLGGRIGSDSTVTDEVNARICKARVTFANLRPWAVLCMAAELKRLQFFDNRCLRTIARVGCCRHDLAVDEDLFAQSDLEDLENELEDLAVEP
ncbi:hypothetical protein T265_05049 [Opisthorchis viverrini]|uniref:C3H1-type domain-containing protein n=1 Tax=Opisthorchis viverrini TaxID=6198 RepID=A0A074ZXC2_OPIVI|nr:hypothetical protein T265_05049 [Opisthorchis viverrini]KER28000.1 hypothetical protein T265_05049 [Opisthorchis viverrini]